VKSVARGCRRLKCLSILITIWQKNCKQKCEGKFDTKVLALNYWHVTFNYFEKATIFLKILLCFDHSMARANLNKSVWLVTNTTAASKYIPT
jgi:hypothetical protein